MISAKFIWGNVLFLGKLQIDPRNSTFEFFESALYMKPVSMPFKNRLSSRFCDFEMQILPKFVIFRQIQSLEEVKMCLMEWQGGREKGF